MTQLGLSVLGRQPIGWCNCNILLQLSTRATPLLRDFFIVLVCITRGYQRIFIKKAAPTKLLSTKSFGNLPEIGYYTNAIVADRDYAALAQSSHLHRATWWVYIALDGKVNISIMLSCRLQACS